MKIWDFSFLRKWTKFSIGSNNNYFWHWIRRFVVYSWRQHHSKVFSHMVHLSRGYNSFALFTCLSYITFLLQCVSTFRKELFLLIMHSPSLGQESEFGVYPLWWLQCCMPHCIRLSPSASLEQLPAAQKKPESQYCSLQNTTASKHRPAIVPVANWGG